MYTIITNRGIVYGYRKVKLSVNTKAFLKAERCFVFKKALITKNNKPNANIIITTSDDITLDF